MGQATETTMGRKKKEKKIVPVLIDFEGATVGVGHEVVQKPEVGPSGYIVLEGAYRVVAMPSNIATPFIVVPDDSEIVRAQKWSRSGRIGAFALPGKLLDNGRKLLMNKMGGGFTSYREGVT